jgi:hypothetical protein
MGFIKNHGVTGRQQLCRALVAEHHVSEKEVMVDHHQIGCQCLATGGQHEALLVVRTVLTKAVVTRRGDHRPHRRVLRDIGALRLVTAACLAGEPGDPLRMGCVVTGKETAVSQRTREVIVAQVVGSPLEQRHLDRRLERLTDGGDIAREELVLQVAGTGRHDDLSTRKQRRHQISIGLAGAGAGLGDQHAIVGHRRSDALGELELLAAQAIAGNTGRQRPICRKDVGKQGGHWRFVGANGNPNRSGHGQPTHRRNRQQNRRSSRCISASRMAAGAAGTSSTASPGGVSSATGYTRPPVRAASPKALTKPHRRL